MTTAADDSAVEDAFEALLAGRPAPGGAAGLAAFTEAVRASATRPGRPHAALADLLATGRLTDQSSPSVRTARSAGSPPARRPSRVRTRRRTAMIFSALLAKFLSAGAVAQAATGATVAVVAFTGVGAAGALPAPVQDTFATVVATVTPLEAPTSEETAGDVVPEETVAEDAVTTEEDAGTKEPGEFDVTAWATEGPDGFDGSFSEWVNAGAHSDVKAMLRENGMSFGDVVSGWANGKGLSEEELAALGVDLDELTDEATTEPETDVVVTETEKTVRTQAGTTVGDRGSRGNGGDKVTGTGTGTGTGKAGGTGTGGNGTGGNGRGNGNN